MEYKILTDNERAQIIQARLHQAEADHFQRTLNVAQLKEEGASDEELEVENNALKILNKRIDYLKGIKEDLPEPEQIVPQNMQVGPQARL